ncbi:MAG: tRNA epoxyqueuosine(34) reductase QueG [Thermoplasmata archaeon]
MMLDLDPPCSWSAVSAVRVRIQDTGRLRDWLSQRLNAGMSYLSRGERMMKLEDPSLLMSGAKSILIFLFRYQRGPTPQPEFGKMASYSLSRDYHILLREEISRYLEQRGLYRDNFRIYVDTGPISERGIAATGGLGWIGKSSMLVNKTLGSFTFIGVAVTDLAIEGPSFPQPDMCGRCTRCIDSCPTHAIRSDRTVDSNLCISYHTIESREVIPPLIAMRMGNMVFGCDICNDVCPWNRPDAKGCEIIRNDEGLMMKLEDLAYMGQEEFRERFGKTAIARATSAGLARNATVALHNAGRDDLVRDIAMSFDDLRATQARVLLGFRQT